MSDGSEHYDRVKAYIKACEGAPDTIRPGAVRAMADALKVLLECYEADVISEYGGTRFCDTKLQVADRAREALRQYHGGEE